LQGSSKLKPGAGVQVCDAKMPNSPSMAGSTQKKQKKTGKMALLLHLGIL
jgi:hypothetical protein